MPDLPAIPQFSIPATSWPGSGFTGAPTPNTWTQEKIDAYRQQIIELILRQVALALKNSLSPGKAFDQIKAWADNLGDDLVEQINANAGINLASWDDFVASLADGKGIDLPILKSGLDFLSSLFGGLDFGDLPTPEDAWQFVVSTFINPLINVVEAVANALLTAPLNAANLFGRIALPQFGSGVPIMSLTTAVPNELEPFKATSELPATEDGNVDGWSFNATEDAVQMVCDGSLKTLYMKSGVIKVEEGQPLDTSIRVKYSGITSGAGQTIRYVLETFTTDDGSGTATPVVIGAVTNPSGTITTPVTLGDSSWDIPVGVKSVRPALVGDELLAAGTVFWLNTPALYKKLDPVFAGGLPAVLNNLGDWIETLVDQLLGALGLPALGSLFDKIMDLGDEIEGWFDDTLNTASDLAGLIGDMLSNPASVLGNLPRTLISGLEAWWDGITAKTVNLTSGGFFDAGKLANITGTISQSLVTGLTSSLNTLNTFIQNVIDAILTALRGVPIIGGVIADIVEDVTGLKETADNALSTADQIVEDTSAGWTGDTPTGTPTPVYDTITGIRNAVSGIYTIEVKTTSGTWTNPGGIVEFWAICIGSGEGGRGGGGGASGSTSGGLDPNGGAGGKYVAQQINPVDLGATVPYTVPAGGAGGAGLTGTSGAVGAAGGPRAAASFGSLASSDVTDSGSIAALVGYYDATISAPGYGGAGGRKNADTAVQGSPGESTPLAAGGTAGGLGSNGTAGGNAPLTGQTRCGGAGGGGGSGNYLGKGGNGGNGGFPGGGGGGGGSGLSPLPGGGNGGNGGNGAIVLIYR